MEGITAFEVHDIAHSNILCSNTHTVLFIQLVKFTVTFSETVSPGVTPVHPSLSLVLQYGGEGEGRGEERREGKEGKGGGRRGEEGRGGEGGGGGGERRGGEAAGSGEVRRGVRVREGKRTELVGREGERRGGGGQEVMSYTVIYMPHTHVHICTHTCACTLYTAV